MKIYYYIPLLPLIARVLIIVRYRDIKWVILTSGQRGKEGSSTIIGMAGFSFAGLIGITVLQSDDQLKKLELPMFYLLVSFLCYFAALNLEGYKFYLISDQISDTLIDIASLSLLCSIVSFIVLSNYSPMYKATALFLAFIVWLVDHALRIIYTNHVFCGVRFKQRRVQNERAHESPKQS